MSKSGPQSDEKEDEGPQNRLASIGKFLDVISQIVGFTSILAALMFYFGYVRSSALYGYFGIDLSLLGFSAQDYVMRSIQGAADPARWTLVIILLLMGGHFLILRWFARHPQIPWARLFIALGALVVIGNLLAIQYPLQPPFVPIFYPLTWTIGICLIAYGLYLSTLTRPSAKSSPMTPGAKVRLASIWLFGGLFLYSLIWTVAVAAQDAGEYRARQISAYLFIQPDVVVYSEKDFHIQAKGVLMDQICSAPDQCWNRYSGLKLLIRSDGKYFLLPASWEPNTGMTIILSEADVSRIEVAAGKAPTPTPTP